MKKNERDTFEGLKRPVFQQDNFFLLDNSNLPQDDIPVSTEPFRRLNDYDSNLLKEDAYKDVADDLFKLEYKIERIEKEISDLGAQIQAAKEIGDYDLIVNLSYKKSLIEEDYEALVALYNNKTLSGKITDRIFSLLGNNFKKEIKTLECKLSSVSDLILSKLPKQFSSVIELKKSLSKLENLNKSVDDLVSLNVPYGENSNKYEQLSKYIIKANSIQAEISRYMNEK